jgi:putative ABC transport system permease protein
LTIFEALRLAWLGITGNRLRSALTMLGMLIGVGAVILLVAVGNGTSLQVQQQVQSLGSNLIYVFPSNATSGGVSQGFGTGQTLTQADVTALQDHSQAPDIVTAVPVANANGILTHGSQNWFAPTTGTTQDFAQARNYEMASGAFFNAEEVLASARVAVIGQTVVTNLFGGDANGAIGQTIKIRGQPFRVVGTFAGKGSSSLGNQDNLVTVPITAAWNYLLGSGNKSVSQILVEATSSASVTQASQEATAILLNQHRISDPTQADFSLLTQQDILNSFSQVTASLTILLGAIAAISLVVGGIGIMNIMLVTVTERTREIGIRKAIGATRGDILLQFLIESMFLSGLGGISGIVVGAGLAYLIGHSGLRLGSLGSLPTPVVSPPSVAIAFLVAVGIGLFFGIYPANRAARLNPIEALRYE